MGKHQKTWNETEKLEVVNFYKVNGPGKTSKEFNVSTATIYRWAELLESQGTVDSTKAFKPDKDKEILRLNRENQAFKEIIAEKELEIRIKDALLKKKI